MVFFCKKIFKIYLIIGILCSALSWSQVFAQAYNFKKINIQDGLSQSQAFSLIFDNKQEAWIGTQGGGITIFDGEEFNYLNISDSLISNRVMAMSQIGNEIFVCQKGGVSIYDQSKKWIRNVRSADSQIIFQSIITKDDLILLGSDKGLYQIVNNKIVPYDANLTHDEIDIQSFFKDPNNDLWVCTSIGMFKLNDPYKKLNKNRGLSTDYATVATFFQDHYVIGLYGGGVNFYNKTVSIPKKLNELKGKIVLSLYNSNNKELWIGTMNNGVYVYNPEKNSLINYNTANGLSNNHVRLIQADYWGNIWIGTSGGGIAIFQNSPFIEYNRMSGLNGDYVFVALNDSKDNIWLATEGTGVMRLNNENNLLFDKEKGFHNEKVKAIYEDKYGGLWFGTEGSSLGYFSPVFGDTIFTPNNTGDRMGNWVRCFAEDEKKQLYIGTGDAGLFRLNRNANFPYLMNFVKVFRKELPQSITALKLIDNKLWFTSASGQFGYLKNNELVIFNKAGYYFRNLIETPTGVWLGTKDNGLLSIKIEGDKIIEEKWLGLEIASSKNIYQLMNTGNTVWIGTEKGLDKIEFDSLLNPFLVDHFGFEDGFKGVETNVNGGSVDKNNNLWIGTVNGLYQFTNNEFSNDEQQYALLFLEDFQIVYESIKSTEYAHFFSEGQIGSGMELPHDKNHLSFNFKAIHFTQVKNIRYRWQMSNVDPSWSPPSKNNAAVYSNLAPGNYVFKVWASANNRWDNPIVIKFKILKPYWQTWPFRLAYYSIIILLFAAIIFFILRRQKKKSKGIQEKLTLEKNLLELEQKALRLQMNPHFIFNALNSIHNLIILNDADNARYALSKFSKLMRQVLENSREKYISIDDELETVSNYIQLERLTTNQEIDFIVDIAEDVETFEPLIPPLILQPFVENAIIHGFKNIDYIGRIKISFAIELDQHLVCIIEDNGKGRGAAVQNLAQKEAFHKSLALEVTQERLSNINGENNQQHFKISDLKDAAGRPIGTKIILKIRL